MSNLITEATNLIASFEGCKLAAYRDPVGIWTIGYGTTYINNLPIKANQKITKDEALELLQNDVSILYNNINRVLPSLSENQMIAVLDFVYNIGFYAFENSTMFKYLKAGQFTLASTQFPLWNHSAGKVLPGLTRRRAAEQEIFNKG